MNYLIGYTLEEADALEPVMLELIRMQLGTVASELGRVTLTDGTIALPADESRLELLSLPEQLAATLALRVTQGRVKSREELVDLGLWPTIESSNE